MAQLRVKNWIAKCIDGKKSPVNSTVINQTTAELGSDNNSSYVEPIKMQTVPSTSQEKASSPESKETPKVNPNAFFQPPSFSLNLLEDFLRLVASGDVEKTEACLKQNEGVIDLLLNKSSSFQNKRDKKAPDNYTALQLAIIMNRDDMINLLLNYKADVNIAGPHGWTALHIAASQGRTDIVKLLLNQPGIDTGVLDSDNLIALDYAEQGRHDEVIVLLQSFKVSNKLP